MRIAITAGCAVLLAFGLSFSSFAGSITDQDSDGVPDIYDNCQDVPNGPLAATDLCDGQEDNDLDGYGDPCDTDANNNGSTGVDDITNTISALNTTDTTYDYSCTGAVGVNDVTNAIVSLNTVPGPSGLGCAGTAPCVAN